MVLVMCQWLLLLISMLYILVAWYGAENSFKLVDLNTKWGNKERIVQKIRRTAPDDMPPGPTSVHQFSKTMRQTNLVSEVRIPKYLYDLMSLAKALVTSILELNFIN